MRVGFGPSLPVSGSFADLNAIRRIARSAESLGFDDIWCHDYITWTRHLHNNRIICGSVESIKADQDPNFFESLSTLSYLAGITKTIGLGVAVLVAPLRNPILAAKQLSMIDNFSQGRLITGIGIGTTKLTNSPDFEIMGISRLEKNDRTDEFIDIMLGLWDHTKSAFSFRGKFSSFENAEMFPKPIQKPHPPIWLAGTIEKALVRVARYAQGWIPGALTPEEFAKGASFITNTAKERFSRDVRDFKVANQVFISIDKSSERAKENAKATLRNNSKVYAAFAGEEAFDRAMNLSLIGSPDEIGEKVRRYKESGVNYYQMKFIYHSLEHFENQLELFSKEVVPSFQT